MGKTYDCLLSSQVVQKAADIQDAISEGANSFLFTEYKYLGVFMVSAQDQITLLAATCSAGGLC